MAWSVTLNWDASIDAVDGYSVYRSTTSGTETGFAPLNAQVINGVFDPLNSGLITGTSWIDNTVVEGTTYYYVVVAVKNGIQSVVSNEIVETILGTAPAPAPTPAPQTTTPTGTGPTAPGAPPPLAVASVDGFLQSASGSFDQSRFGFYLTTADVVPAAGLQTVGVDSTAQLYPGLVIVFDAPGGLAGAGNPETVTILSVGTGTITAVFAKPHPLGSFRALVSLWSLSVTLPFESKVGDAVLVSFQATAALNSNPFTITDNFFNEYAPLAFIAGTGFGNTSGGVYLANVTSPGQITVTLTLQSGEVFVEMLVDSYAGPLSVDQIAVHTNSGDGGNSTPITTTHANEMLYSIGMGEGGGDCIRSFTPPTGGGWTTRDSLTLGPVGLASWDKIVSATGTYVSDPQIVSPASGDGSGGVSAFIVFLFSFAIPGPSSDIITDICERSGLLPPQIDVSRVLISANFPTLTNVVPGYLCERPTPGADLIKTLMEGYFFDACESDGTMRFVPRGLGVAMTIPEGDLGLVADHGKLTERIMQEQDLPKRITVLYNDPILDYQQGKQQKERTSRVVQTRQNVIMSLPLTMSGTQARYVAEIALYTAWLNRSSYSMNLWRSLYMLLDPSDEVQFVYEGLTFKVRILDTKLGAGYVVEMNSVLEDERNYISFATGIVSSGSGGPGPGNIGTGGITLAANSVLFLLDIPLLADTDSNTNLIGYYAGMGSLIANWPGAALYDSSDQVSWASEVGSTKPIQYGTATTILAAPVRSPWIWDTVNTVTVKMALGTLGGNTDLNVLNGANQIIVGEEIIQFAYAALNADGSYTLSRLLRGRRGTEWAIGIHAVGELVVLPGNLIHEPLPVGDLNKLRYYQAVTVGQVLGTGTVDNLSSTGAELKPYAPVHVKGVRDDSQNLTLTWTRRTRLGWASLSQDPVPLSEDSELYSVDILNGSTVVRTINAITSPTTAYTAAQQTADFGSPQSSVSVNVYQISGEVGRGFVNTVSV